MKDFKWNYVALTYDYTYYLDIFKNCNRRVDYQISYNLCCIINLKKPRLILVKLLVIFRNM